MMLLIRPYWELLEDFICRNSNYTIQLWSERDIKMSRLVIFYNLLEIFQNKEFDNLNLHINYDALAEFLMNIFSFKPKAWNSFKSNQEGAMKIHDCMRKYTSAKFDEIKFCYELKILAAKINNCYLDQFLSSKDKMCANKEKYMKAIDDFIK